MIKKKIKKNWDIIWESLSPCLKIRTTFKKTRLVSQQGRYQNNCDIAQPHLKLIISQILQTVQNSFQICTTMVYK